MFVLALALGDHHVKLAVNSAGLDQGVLVISHQGKVHREVGGDQDVLEVLALIVLDVVAGEQCRGLSRKRGVILDLGDLVGLEERLVALLVTSGRVKHQPEVQQVKELILAAIALLGQAFFQAFGGGVKRTAAEETGRLPVHHPRGHAARADPRATDDRQRRQRRAENSSALSSPAARVADGLRGRSISWCTFCGSHALPCNRSSRCPSW